jgi:uncharacterized protein (TIGR00645 family)
MVDAMAALLCLSATILIAATYGVLTQITILNQAYARLRGFRNPPVSAMQNAKTLKPLPWLLFGSRWLQLPLYVGLIVAQVVYVIQFMAELKHLILEVAKFNEITIMLTVLGLIDVVMISNLLIMVIIGGYETFVSRLHLEGHPDEPEWLSHVNANVLKVKLATAIIGISSIHLLKTFINAENLAEKTMYWQVVIHITFLVSAVAIAAIDRIMLPATVEHMKRE